MALPAIYICFKVKQRLLIHRGTCFIFEAPEYIRWRWCDSGQKSGLWRSRWQGWSCWQSEKCVSEVWDSLKKARKQFSDNMRRYASPSRPTFYKSSVSMFSFDVQNSNGTSSPFSDWTVVLVWKCSLVGDTWVWQAPEIPEKKSCGV